MIDQHYVIGKVYLRKLKPIYIIDGYYTDPTYGRLSNHWTWRPVKKDGTLGKRQNGYGDTNIQPVKCKIEIKVIL